MASVETPQRVGVADRFDEMGEEVELAASEVVAREHAGSGGGERRRIERLGGIEARTDGAEMSSQHLGPVGIT